ncbi:thiamine/thiamine pyrophosphate ABC transporter permease [Veronia pacifica]|uniref:Thiamine transport system permease protein ThiP n=1 Tax=Veronia pacifica TaxID=1080227 RepID=A0A1C3EQ64_9GAMM|nr:thiamine/thiamine pyrophosphate ABC transporter permease [Veronia pacifica]ODA35332.1 thiamine/thiamine pyrophosphate ABC transporter, permease protein [Veronia pacifica]
MLNPSRTWPGTAAASLISLLIFAALLSLLIQAPSLDIGSLVSDAYLRHVTVFSIKQAFLSTLLSVGLAIPVAHALSRRHFRGKRLLLRLFSMTLVMPVLVGVFGILAICGNQGLIKHTLASFGVITDTNIYGLNGILLAHIFFNMPFAAQLLVQTLERIPAPEQRLAHQLGMTGWHRFKLLEWPFIRQQLPHIAGLVFMLCFTSFATVMALGGGPSATTIELAIYQAIRFDFDLQTGALLALWQLILCAAFHWAVQRANRPLSVSVGGDNLSLPARQDSPSAKCWDVSWITVATVFVLSPLVMVVYQGINPSSADVFTAPTLWKATLNTLKIATMSSLIAFVLGGTIVLSSRFWRLNNMRKKADTIEMIATIILVVPSVVLSTGLFLLIRSVADVFSMAFWLVIIANALMALPYVVKVLSQPALQLSQQYNSLCSSLGIKGVNRLKLIEWQVLRGPIARALAVSFALSTGDLGAISLVGSQQFETLPLYLFRLMGSYQMDAAAAASLVLFLLCLGCYSFIEFIVRKAGHAKGQ